MDEMDISTIDLLFNLEKKFFVVFIATSKRIISTTG
jgi:hypothetical protein